MSRRGSLNLAGLLGGDSDSSGLTSGDEVVEVDSAKPSRGNSVVTGAPTEGTMEDEEETAESFSKWSECILYTGAFMQLLAPTRGRRGRRPRGTPRGRGTPTGGRRPRGRRLVFLPSPKITLYILVIYLAD